MIAALAVAASACSSSDTVSTGSTETESGSTAPASSGDTSETSTTDTSDSSTTTTDDDAPLQTLPGEPFEGFAQAGDRLIVVGVAHDDTLNVREGPGTEYPVMSTFEPTESNVVATGDARLLERSLWYGLEVGSGDGWVNASYLAFEGTVDDTTSQVVASIGEIPTAETMEDLGLVVAEERSSSDVESDVVMVVGPTVGDLGEVTYDVIGLADDSVYGLRLHVFGEPIPGAEGFSLKAVEETTLCGRGVSESGLCV